MELAVLQELLVQVGLAVHQELQARRVHQELQVQVVVQEHQVQVELMVRQGLQVQAGQAGQAAHQELLVVLGQVVHQELQG